jgi:hypothetical protein
VTEDIYRRLDLIEAELERLRKVDVGGAVVAFTPTYNGATPGVTTYTNQVGAYAQLGDVVFVVGRVTWTATTGTGVAVIGGLPLTSQNTAALRYPAAAWYSAVTFGGSFVEALLAENSTAFTMYTTTTNANATQLNVEAAGDVAFTLVYFI